MKLYSSMTHDDVKEWWEKEDVEKKWSHRNVPHPANQEVDFHFHEVEEWLEVLDGDITFYSANEKSIQVTKGGVLSIPQGEVHRVKVGSKGVLYQMWLPDNVSSAMFSRRLDRDHMSLIRANLDLPDLENKWDAGRPPQNPTTEILNTIPGALLEAFVSEKLSFRNAAGKTIGKLRYLHRDASNNTREPEETGSVCILHRCPECVVLSTVVNVHLSKGGSELVMNLRLFGREEDEWRCRTWINFKI